MSFPVYEEYKDSGDELLGNVPTHWGVWKLAHAFTQIGSGTTPKSDKAEYYDDGTIPWVNTGDLDDRPLIECAKNITRKAVKEHSTLKLYPAGSLLFAMYGATIGKIGLLEFPATVNQACCVFSGESPISIKYLFYWFLGLRQRILSLATGGGQPNVSQDILRTLRVTCPNEDEQHTIASFLDAETSKIDGLVSEQRRLIELLKEKRQAVISHAVTKGLNPDVAMKPSGIEWLGDVPEHWEVSRVKYVSDGFMYGTSSDCNTEECGTPVLRIPNVKRGFIDFSDLKFANFPPGEEERYLLKENDILVVRTNGNPKLVGKSALFQGRKKCMFASYLIKIRPRPNIIIPAFLNVVMNAPATREMLTLSARTSAGNYNMNCEGLGGTNIVLPPFVEQKEIFEFLDERLADFDLLIAEAERAIALLQERRTALISAAVTGKIDVRDFALQEAG